MVGAGKKSKGKLKKPGDVKVYVLMFSIFPHLQRI